MYMYIKETYQFSTCWPLTRFRQLFFYLRVLYHLSSTCTCNKLALVLYRIHSISHTHKCIYVDPLSACYYSGMCHGGTSLKHPLPTSCPSPSLPVSFIFRGCISSHFILYSITVPFIFNDIIFHFSIIVMEWSAIRLFHQWLFSGIYIYIHVVHVCNIS